MVQEHIQQSVESAKKHLEGILLEYDSHIIAGADRKYIGSLMGKVNDHIESEAKTANYKDISNAKGRDSEPYAMQPFSFSDEEIIILSKIQDHAEYMKNNGRIGYRLGLQFFTPEELETKLYSYMKDKFVFPRTKNLLSSFVRQINDSRNLSAKQIITFENLIDEVSKRKSEILSGSVDLIPYVPFGPAGMEIKEYSQRIVNFVVGRGRKNCIVSGEDILEMRKKYMTEEGKVDLNPLRKEIKTLSGNEKVFSKYEAAFSVLETYLNAIDPEKHIVDGLYSAKPRVTKG